MAKSPKKVLIVSYYWLPHSGTGSYRISKIVKYLIKLGWEPVILTPGKTTIGFNEAKIDSIYQNVKIYQTKIIEPTFFFKSKANTSQNMANTLLLLRNDLSLKQRFIRWVRLNIFIPDAKILWKRFAVAKGKEVIKKEKPDIILSTSPPPTAHLVARSLAKWSKLHWVADFRDPWTNIFYYEQLKINPISRKINKALEKKVLDAADRIVTVSDGFFPEHDYSSKTIRIENGYDPEDLPEVNTTASKNEKFTISYIGSLKTNQFFKNFFEVLKELTKDEEFQKKLKFEIAGYMDPSIRDYLNREVKNLEINIQGYLPHSEAIRQMSEADLLILAIGKGKQSKNVISTKIFEYLMVRKPILAFGPSCGAANRILQETNAGKMFDYNDYIALRQYLLEIYSDWSQGKKPINDIKNAEKYNFQNLTIRLKNVFEQYLGN